MRLFPPPHRRFFPFALIPKSAIGFGRISQRLRAVAVFGLMLAAALFALAAGCATQESPPARPQYGLVCSKGVSFEPGKSGYDAGLGGYWLRGMGTVRLDPLPSVAGEKAAGLVLSIRAEHIALLRVGTPERVFSLRGADPSSLVVAPQEDASRVEILRNSGHIGLARENGRVRVELSAQFLRIYAPHGASLSWFDSQ
jgi:hypothetical protein